MNKKQIAVMNVDGFRAALNSVWEIAKAYVTGGKPILITIVTRSVRSLEANRKMWAMLNDLSKQVEWPVDGLVQKITAEEWKDILTAATKSELRMAAGVNGGVVFLGVRTSKMTIKQMNDLIEYLYAFGSERDVIWSEPLPADWFELDEAA